MAAARRKVFTQQAQPLLQQLASTRTPAQPTPATPDVQAAAAAPIDPLALPTDITRPAKTLMSSLAKFQRLKSAAEPGTIKKSNGKVTTQNVDPYAGHEANPHYEPIPSDEQYKNGMDIEQLAEHEATARGIPGARRVKYKQSVRSTNGERMDRVEAIANDASPDDANVLGKWLLPQLLHVNSAEQGMRAIVHTRSHLTPETYAKLKASFTPDVLARVFNGK